MPENYDFYPRETNSNNVISCIMLSKFHQWEIPKKHTG